MGLGTVRQGAHRAVKTPAEPGGRLYQGWQKQLLRGKGRSALSRGHGPEGPSPCGRHQAWRVVQSSRCPHSTDENTEAQGRRPQIR